MNVHKNARLTPIGRERIVMQVTSGQTPQAAARAAGVCPRTVRKWVAHYAALGITGLQDRSSRPRRANRPTPQHIVARIGELRRQRLSRKHIAASVGVSTATLRNPKLTVHDIAREERVSAAYLYSLLRLPWLALDITTAIINGRKPPQLTAQTLMRLTPRLPPDWAEQRKLLGFR